MGESSFAPVLLLVRLFFDLHRFEMITLCMQPLEGSLALTTPLQRQQYTASCTGSPNNTVKRELYVSLHYGNSPTFHVDRDLHGRHAMPLPQPWSPIRSCSRTPLLRISCVEPIFPTQLTFNFNVMIGSYSSRPLWPTRGDRSSSRAVDYELVYDKQGRCAVYCHLYAPYKIYRS
jgi:hypothetical protein